VKVFNQGEEGARLAKHELSFLQELEHARIVSDSSRLAVLHRIFSAIKQEEQTTYEDSGRKAYADLLHRWPGILDAAGKAPRQRRSPFVRAWPSSDHDRNINSYQMEEVTGQPLLTHFKMISSRRSSAWRIKECGTLAAWMADAIAAMAQTTGGLHHGDLNPRNVIVETSGHPVGDNDDDDGGDDDDDDGGDDDDDGGGGHMSSLTIVDPTYEPWDGRGDEHDVASLLSKMLREDQEYFDGAPPPQQTSLAFCPWAARSSNWFVSRSDHFFLQRPAHGRRPSRCTRRVKGPSGQ
jgi:hypothetical protein